MRHRKAGVKLNRTSSHKNAMFRNMVTSLLKYDRIQTTDAKAKELRRWADKLITLAKRGDLHARRLAMSIVREKDVVHKLFEEAADRFGKISGGYTRVIKVGRRPGDAAPVSLVELVAAEPADKKKKSAKKTKSAKAKKTETPTAVAPEADKAAATADVIEDAPAEAKVEEAAAEAVEAAEAEAPVEAAGAADAGTEASGAEDAGEAPDKKEEK